MGNTSKKTEDNLNVFRLLRIARDKKVKELAEELLVTPSYINAIEKGDRKPSERLIRDYAEALHVDVEVIKTFSEKTGDNTKFEQRLLSLLQIICSLDDTKNKRKSQSGGKEKKTCR
ncbi:MAG: helix-turn-helix transcriptional regulator [Ruminococcus sp.]|jgi:transcriptional regulator with XRE-family HTH domain